MMTRFTQTSSPLAKFRRGVNTCLLMLLGFALAGLVTEGLARVLFPHWAPRTGTITSFWRHDELLGWSHIPNSSGRFDSFGFESVVRINSRGFRDVERFYERHGSKFRIVVLGDSMVWGWGVQQDQIFTALAERQRQDIEVINLGVSGYGTDQELILLRLEALPYCPDLIVVVVMDNDFDTNTQTSLFLGYQKPMFELGKNGSLVLTNTPVPKQSIWVHSAAAAMQDSYLLNQAARAYERIQVRRGPSPPTAQSSHRIDQFPGEYKEALTAALLMEIHKEAKDMGSRVLLLLADRMGSRGEEITTFFRSRGIDILNLDPVFPRDHAIELHLSDSIHWTAAGHQRVADQLLRYLDDVKVVQASSGPCSAKLPPTMVTEGKMSGRPPCCRAN
jgi:lysophospholipase L1-like esterase